MWPQTGTIFVKSANGQIDQRPITKPLHVTDKGTGLTALSPIIFIENCPVNLLGRDLMSLLKLSLVPVTGGMRAVGPQQTVQDQIFVQASNGEPYYFWALDMPTPDVSGTGEHLLKMITKTPKQELMAPENLHVTLRYKRSPGPDREYDAKVSALGPQRVAYKAIYEDDKGNAVVTIQLPEPVNKVMLWGQYPHISLAKQSGTKWYQLGTLAKIENDDRDWEEDTGGWYKSGPYRRKYLGFTVIMTPHTHLDDSRRTQA